MTERPTKITFVEMRDIGVRGLLLYCADYRCSQSIAIGANPWPDDLRLSDIEERRNRLEAVEPAASSFAVAPTSPAENQFDETALTQRHDQRGNCLRMSSMVELVVAVVALMSACIFLRTRSRPFALRMERGTQDNKQ
jgi:hypothetical protein